MAAIRSGRCSAIASVTDRSSASASAPPPSAKASSKSSLMSSMCSMPTETRTWSGVTPALFCSASVSCWWVVEAGWMTSVFASPTLARCDASFTASMNVFPAS